MTEINSTQLIEITKRSFVKENSTGMNTCVQLNLVGAGGGNWFMKIKNQTLDVQDGSSDDANVEINMNVEDFLGIITGDLDPLKAFFMGKVKIVGDQSVVMKMVALFRVSEADLKLIRG
jgi:putative sterol carrier protein